VAPLLQDPDDLFNSSDVRGGLLLRLQDRWIPEADGKESYKKWQCSFFYVKNLGKDIDHVNLPPFDARGPGERDNWSASLPGPGPDMANIL
jgi:hypothetical protein